MANLDIKGMHVTEENYNYLVGKILLIKIINIAKILYKYIS